MDEQDRMLAESEVGRRVIEDDLNLEATHYAETAALIVKVEAGSENDKMADDRQ